MSSSGVLLFTLLLVGYLYWSLAQPTNMLQIRCRLTAAVPDERMCPYGAYISYCNKLACKQGPGKPCGNELDRDRAIKFGECADGLACCNNRCHGCYRENCFDEACNPMNMGSYGTHSYDSVSQDLQPFHSGYFFNYFDQ
ncbi:uncharacterized protein LOC118456813 [Anopheles albimanus]|uniref:uncharacterized protein LOC118456813 n=1 Tax=Anopheles albimanus TaxID=7167 RepID=UPI00163E1C31|nr:uncharacterized protein LOC118456813 [Anopheles albimanus]